MSGSEAEWVAASEAVKEVMLVLQLLQSMKIKVRLLIIVHVDNVGAIFMTKISLPLDAPNMSTCITNLSQSRWNMESSGSSLSNQQIMTVTL